MQLAHHICLAHFAVLCFWTYQALAQIDLGAAASFALLAAYGIDNTGNTILDGQIGIYPRDANSITGFPPGVSSGVFDGNPANQAQAAAANAYDQARQMTTDVTITSFLGDGQVLLAGTYSSPASVSVVETLVLDGQGNPNAVFVFQIGQSLDTGDGASIVLVNGARSCNVFWQMANAAYFRRGTNFAGSIIARNAIDIESGVTIIGGLYCLNGYVHLNEDTVKLQSNCPILPPASSSSLPASSSSSLPASSSSSSPGSSSSSRLDSSSAESSASSSESPSSATLSIDFSSTIASSGTISSVSSSISLATTSAVSSSTVSSTPPLVSSSTPSPTSASSSASSAPSSNALTASSAKESSITVSTSFVTSSPLSSLLSSSTISSTTTSASLAAIPLTSPTSPSSPISATSSASSTVPVSSAAALTSTTISTASTPSTASVTLISMINAPYEASISSSATPTSTINPLSTSLVSSSAMSPSMINAPLGFGISSSVPSVFSTVTTIPSRGHSKSPSKTVENWKTLYPPGMPPHHHEAMPHHKSGNNKPTTTYVTHKKPAHGPGAAAHKHNHGAPPHDHEAPPDKYDHEAALYKARASSRRS